MYPISRNRDRGRSKSSKSVSSVLWTPSQISTATWLDADDASTIVLNGSTVSQWTDKSGNSLNATQAIAAQQPAYSIAAINGKNALSLDGVDDWMSLATATYTDSGCAFAVISPNSDPTYSAFLSVSSEYTLYLGGATLTQVLRSTRITPGALGVPSTGAFILGYRSHSLSPLYELAVNGSVVATNTVAFTVANPPNSIGSNQSTNKFAGLFAELVLVNAQVSLDNRQRMEGYLAWKWGLQGNLPVGHPYKNSPPTV